MTPQDILRICLSKEGAYLDYPFGPDVATARVGKTDRKPGRIFAQVFSLRGEDTVTLNCGREAGEYYRGLFPGVVVRGYHCPPVQQPYFNTMPADGVPDDVLTEMIEHSYQTVLAKLPAAERPRAAGDDDTRIHTNGKDR